jgi:hypothetical protein
MRAIILALLLMAAPALAQDRPLTMPTRDVDVIYRVGGGMEQRMRWGVTLGKLRVDPPSPGLYMVLDTRTRVMETVREGERTVLQIDGMAPPVPGTAPSQRFVRHGTAEVAGLPCVLWDTMDTQGRPTTACLTADGVLLRAESGGGVLLEATQVRFAPLPGVVFQVPAEYRRIMAPALSRKPG